MFCSLVTAVSIVPNTTNIKTIKKGFVSIYCYIIPKKTYSIFRGSKKFVR